MNTTLHTATRMHSRPAGGFTLLEVMVALMILAVGVLGVIALQLSTYEHLRTSQNFTRAALLAADMADRMLANRDEAIADAYLHAIPPAGPPARDCETVTCNPQELAAHDIWRWQAMLASIDPEDPERQLPGALPSASGEVRRNGTGEFMILVRWDDMSSSTGSCATLDPGAPAGLDCYALNLGCLRSGVFCAPDPP